MLREDIINRSKGYKPQPIAPPKGTAAWADAQSGQQTQQSPRRFVPTSQQKEQVAPQPQLKRQTMEELLNVLRGKPVLTDEEQKRSKRDRLISNIGSGISALANLFFASKGAPSMWTARNSSAAHNNIKWQQLIADRNREREAYINQQMKAKMYDDEAAVRNAQLAAQKARDERDAKRYQWEEELQPYKAKVAEENARKVTAGADKAETDARYAGQLNEAELTRRKAATSNANASANANNARAQHYRTGGGGKDTYTLNVAGKTYNYNTLEEYKKAVMSFAKKYEVDRDREVVETEDLGGDLKQEKKRKVRRDYADIAAEIELLSNPDVAIHSEQDVKMSQQSKPTHGAPVAKAQNGNPEMRKAAAKAEADEWSNVLNWKETKKKRNPMHI